MFEMLSGRFFNKDSTSINRGNDEGNELFDACRLNDLEKIKTHLQQGHPVNGHYDSGVAAGHDHKEFSGYTPLHFAVRNRNKKVVIYLLNNDADITEKCSNCWTPVHLAYYTADYNLVRTIFDHSSVNAHVNAVDNTGLTHLHICCALNVPVVEKFIASGANLNCSVSLLADDNCGFTPLHLAIENGHSSIARLILLESSVDATIKDSRGRTALHCAVERRANLDVIELLIAKGASVIHEPDNVNETPFNLALTSRQYAVVDAMLSQFENEGDAPFSFSALFDLDDFHDACSQGNLNDIKAFLKHGFSIHSRTSTNCEKEFRGCTPLHFAVINANVDLVRYLINEGASIREPNYENETPLELAVKRRQYQVVDAMLSQCKSEDGTPASFSDIFDLSVFHDVCRQGNFNGIKSFLERGFSVNSHAGSSFEEKFHGCTPLHFAVDEERVDIIIYLLENGADIAEKSDSGWTPIHQAYYNKSGHLISLMFAHSKINTYVDVADEKGLAHFHICCKLNLPDAVKCFISCGADVNRSTSSGFTPLHFAVQHEPMVKLLLENGADHSSKSAGGSTILHLACAHWPQDSAKLLLEFGANFMVKDHNNRLPLHCAFHEAPNSSLVDLLFAKIPTDCNHTDFLGLSVLHMACFKSNAVVVERLLEQGCSPNTRIIVDEKIITSSAYCLQLAGLTPLHMALYSRNPEIVERLLLAGADINAEDAKGNSSLSYAYDDPLGILIRKLDDSAALQEIDRIVGNHMKKLEIAGMRVSDKVDRRFSLRKICDDRARRVTERLVDHDACKIELEKLQRVKIDNCDGEDLRGILRKSEEQMSRLVKNENVTAFLNPEFLDNLTKEFPLYGFVVKAQVNRGLRRAAMVQEAEDSLKCLTVPHLPDLCSELIVQYLWIEHLENLIEAKLILQRERLHDVANESLKTLDKQ